MHRVIKRSTLGALSLLVILVCLAPLLHADANEVHASYFSGSGSPSDSNNSIAVEVNTEAYTTKPGFIYVYADWCHYSQQESPIIDELEQAYSGAVKFTRINSQQDPQTVDQLGVEGFPTMFLLRESEGKQDVYRRFDGFTAKEVLQENLDGLILGVTDTGYFGDTSADLQANPSPQISHILEICDWQGCTAGAASISADDSYSYCRVKLNKHNWKGTFYLQGTGNFTQTDWDLWRSIYQEGHELGGHTQTHPCYAVDDTALRYELSSNKNDIVSHLGANPQEVTSMAWPCGFSTEQERQIAREYFISARTYLVNELEDKAPADFMNLKSFNSPQYGSPDEEPPDLLTVADMAESQGKWANYVFHNSCEDGGVIDYLATKDLWVAPVGWVAKYALERQQSQLINLQNTASYIKFNMVNNQNHLLYNQELTLKVLIGNATVQGVQLNRTSQPFTPFTANGTNYIKFNVVPSGNDEIEIWLQSSAPVCGNSYLEGQEECDDGGLLNGDGCSSDCEKEDVQLYLAPYIGDIDGSLDPDWFFFFNELRQWHDTNNIPVAMSFYPNTMDSPQFNRIIGDIYASKNVELITKTESSVNGRPTGLMSYSEAKAWVAGLQNKFITEMGKLGYTNVKPPVSYNQNQAEFTEAIRNAIRDVGFKIYFEQYVSEYGYIDSLPDFDVMQYSVKFSTTGQAGPETSYKKPDQVIQEILNFQSDHMLYINGIKVVSLLAHQQDFMISEDSSVVNQDKWDTYKKVLLWAKGDPRIRLLTPEQIYDLRHPQIQVCQYASSAAATSENNPDSIAPYALGAPDASEVGICSDWSGPGYSWSSRNWEVTATLTTTFETPVYATQVTIYGDYDICWDRIWLRNSGTGEQLLIFEGSDTKCISTHTVGGNFLADTVVLETCGSSWSSTDAVQLCGYPPTGSTQTHSSRGILFLVMDDLQKGWLEDVAAAAVQVNIDENVDLLVNVVPYQIGSADVLSPKLKAWDANQRGLIEIGQHGYSHSERMGNLPYGEQRTVVEKGLSELNSLGIRPESFTPPGGSQNTVTLDVLGDLGFHSDIVAYHTLNLISTPRIVALQESACGLCDKWGTEGSQCNLKPTGTLMGDIDSAISAYGYAVVAFHMQDFSTASGSLDTAKLNQYGRMLRDLKNSGKYRFMTPEEYYGTMYLTPAPTAAPTIEPTQTQTREPEYAGCRVSEYGIDPFPSSAGWEEAIKTVANHWPSSTPTAIWLVGEFSDDSNDCQLQFPNATPGITYPYITFDDTSIDHEEYLSFFDTVGIKVLLSVEPGDADVPTLIDLVLNRFGHHPSVIGFGVDVEWNLTSQDNGGAPVTDAQAQAWEAKVKSHNSAYRLFLKHWLTDKMPPNYRGDIIFVDDGQGFSSFDDMVSEFNNYWSAAFNPNLIFFQVGYESDKSWWTELADPPKDIGDAICAAIAQECGVFWVDFTLRDVLPTQAQLIPPTTTPPTPVSSRISWQLVGGIMAGIVLAAWGSYFLVNRSRRTPPG